MPFYVPIRVNNLWDEFGHSRDQNLGFWVKRVGTRNIFLTELMIGRLSELQVSCKRAITVAYGSWSLKRAGL